MFSKSKRISRTVSALGLLIALSVVLSCTQKKASVQVLQNPNDTGSSQSAAALVLGNLTKDLAATGLAKDNVDFIVKQAFDAVNSTTLHFSLNENDISFVGPTAGAGAITALSNASAGMAGADQTREMIKVILNSIVESFQMFKGGLDKNKLIAFQAILSSSVTRSLQPAGLTTPDYELALTDVSHLLVSVAQKLGTTETSPGELISALTMGLVSGLKEGGLTTAQIIEKMKYLAEGATSGAAEVSDVSLADSVGSVSGGVTKGLSSISTLTQEELTQATKAATSAISGKLPTLTTDTNDLKAISSNVATKAIEALSENGVEKNQVLDVSAEIVSSTVEGLQNGGLNANDVGEVSTATQDSAAQALAKTGLSSEEIIAKLQAALDALKAASLPSATIVGAPTGGSYTSSFSLVVGGPNVVTFKYALVSGTSCSGASYSSEKAAATAHSISLSAVSNGDVILCILGKNAANVWQETPVSKTWEKTSVATFTFLADGNAPSASLIQTSSNSASISFSGPAGTTYCTTTIATQPLSVNGCWSSQTSQTVNINNGTTVVVYGWAKTAKGTIVPLGSSTYSNTNDPNSASLGGNLPVGGSSDSSFTLTASGQGLLFYKYTAVSGDSCAGVNWASITAVDPLDNPSSTVSVAALPDGEVTVCLIGRYQAGWQSTPTSHTWDKISGSSYDFSIEDAATGSQLNTNSTTVKGNFTGLAGTSFCTKTTSTPPAANDACWSTSTQIDITISSGTSTNIYVFAKTPSGNIVTLGSSSITHSTFTNFAGASSATATNGKHIRLNWTAANTPHNFDRYHIYYATSSNGQNFSAPNRVVYGGNIEQHHVGGLDDATTYYFVVRAATATFEDKNTQEVSATTINGITVPNVGSLSTLYNAIMNYFGGFSPSTIDIGELATVAGRASNYNTVTDLPSLSLAKAGAVGVVGPRAMALASDGSIFFSNSRFRIAAIDTNDNITMKAGSGSSYMPGYNPFSSGYVSGGLALSQVLGGVEAMTFASDGTLFFADPWNTIRKLTTDGNIVAAYGNGTDGNSNSGNVVSNFGGPGGVEPLGDISSMVFDSNGNLYITESNNNTIKRIDTDGEISLVAGSSNTCPDLDDIGSSSLEDVLVDGGNAVNAKLCRPRGLVFHPDDGRLFFADTENNVIRFIEFDYYDYDLDETYNRIQVYAGQGEYGYPESTTNGPASSRYLWNPWSLAFDSDGNLFFSQAYDNYRDAGRIYKINTSDNLTRVAGGGSQYEVGITATNMVLGNVRNLFTLSTGEVIFADEDYNLIYRLKTDGVVELVAGQSFYGYSGDGGAATAALLKKVAGLERDSQGNLYVAESEGRRIRKINTAGVISTIVGNGTYGMPTNGSAATGTITDAGAMRLASNGDLYFASTFAPQVLRRASDGNLYVVAGTGTAGFSGEGVTAATSRIQRPEDLLFDAQGRLLIAESDYNGHSRVRRLESDGKLYTIAGTGTAGFAGNGVAATSANIKARALSQDAQGNLYIVEQFNNRILKMSTAGTITTFMGNGSYGSSADGTAASSALLYGPVGMEFGPNGDIFISQWNGGDGAITRVSTDGKVHNVSNGGDFLEQHWGDGGPATAAGIGGVDGPVKFDSNGNIYFPTYYHIRYIRMK